MPASVDHGHGWISQRAVAWVIDYAPVPADLAWTLTVIARSCDKNGRGARQSASTIAEKAGKSPKQVQRDIVRLRELGLLAIGDQRLVKHLPMGQRPTVYDLPLQVRGPKPIKESRNPSGGKKGDGRPGMDAESRPPLDGTPPLQGTPPLDGRSTPPLQGVPTPPLQGREKNPPEEPLEEPSSPLPPSPSAGAPSGPDGKEEDIIEEKKPGSDADAFVDQLPAVNGKRLHANERDQLAVAVADRLAAGWTAADLRQALTVDLGSAHGPGIYRWRLTNQVDDKPPATVVKPARPKWCGQCDERTRLIDVEDADGTIRPGRCRRCHPLRVGQQTITGVVANQVTGGRRQPANLSSTDLRTVEGE